MHSIHIIKKESEHAACIKSFIFLFLIIDKINYFIIKDELPSIYGCNSSCEKETSNCTCIKNIFVNFSTSVFSAIVVQPTINDKP